MHTKGKRSVHEIYKCIIKDRQELIVELLFVVLCQDIEKNSHCQVLCMRDNISCSNYSNSLY